MTNRRGVLLGVFVNGDDTIVDEAVQKILESFSLTSKYIFILKNEEEENKTLITFNALQDRESIEKLRFFTIRLHRKKQSNTLYTINGLNLAVAKENNGQTGKHLKLNWEEYQNTVLLSYNRSLKTFRVKLDKILEIEQ
tara:strand:+ start:7009 stop:7425 length:417 start_codon:yes stop_codon:yes gene_type:complete